MGVFCKSRPKCNLHKMEHQFSKAHDPACLQETKKIEREYSSMDLPWRKQNREPPQLHKHLKRQDVSPHQPATMNSETKDYTNDPTWNLSKWKESPSSYPLVEYPCCLLLRYGIRTTRWRW